MLRLAAEQKFQQQQRALLSARDVTLVGAGIMELVRARLLASTQARARERDHQERLRRAQVGRAGVP
jgi:hypothetical protein